MSLYKPGSSSSAPLTGRTEFEILKASHKFLRDEDEEASRLTWEQKVAQKYYSNLYREFAVCDLKHYKSGNFALRWRTEEEVVSGAGETTCGNTRCPLHWPRNIDPDDPRCALKTLELPFSYVEDGENKLALVKVVLCDKCCKKLMYKRNKEKEKEREKLLTAELGTAGSPDVPGTAPEEIPAVSSAQERPGSPQRGERPSRRNGSDEDEQTYSRRLKKRDDGESKRGRREGRHRQSSRSRSPRRRVDSSEQQQST